MVNAGIAAGGQLLQADVAAYDRVIDVNLLGSMRTVRAFLPSVVERHGYVLQVASLAAVVPAPFMSAYGASKAGVEGFAHSLRVEMVQHGVDVGVAYLSWTDTEMVRGADRTAGLREIRAELPGLLRKTHPLEAGGRHDRRRDRAARCPHLHPALAARAVVGAWRPSWARRGTCAQAAPGG